VQASAAELSRTQSAATARHSLGVLRRVFDYAVRDGVIPRNPATGIRLSKVQGNDPRPPTHDEPCRLAGQLDGARDRLLVLVAGYCGLRWGELAGCDGRLSTCKPGPCESFGQSKAGSSPLSNPKPVIATHTMRSFHCTAVLISPTRIYTNPA